MTYSQKLDNLIAASGGLIYTKDVTESGIPRQYISKYVAAGILEQLERGAYLSSDAFDDEMFRLQKRFPAAIFSHGTALYLHDLSDRDPLKYSMTVPTGYNAKGLKEIGADVFYVKHDLLDVGKSQAKTFLGRDVVTYNMERTLCDIVRSRKRMDISLIVDAYKQYVKRSDKDISRLMKYAEMFRVKQQVRNYLEVLL